MAESTYSKLLSADRKKRYSVKISKIDNVDPYTLKKSDFVYEQDFYPKITYPDIVNYLLFAPTPVTSEEMKNYKSLESYNQFLCGWVKEIGIRLYQSDSICLVYGRVRKQVLDLNLIKNIIN